MKTIIKKNPNGDTRTAKKNVTIKLPKAPFFRYGDERQGLCFFIKMLDRLL